MNRRNFLSLALLSASSLVIASPTKKVENIITHGKAPVWLPDKVLRGHMLTVGGSGSGKTIHSLLKNKSDLERIKANCSTSILLKIS
jgi:hypothetical protein